MSLSSDAIGRGEGPVRVEATGQEFLGVYMIKNISLRAALLGAAALSLVACGGETAPAATGADAAGGAAPSADAKAGPTAPGAAAAPAATPAGPTLVKPVAWMPADWDIETLYLRGDPPSETAYQNAQRFMADAPLAIWMLANQTMLDEEYQPIWVWWTAVKSCAKAEQLIEDLSGEFGDRERGKATLTEARNELLAFAATQPPELTVYFTSQLGQWNETTGKFPFGKLSGASAIPIEDLEPILKDKLYLGNSIQLYGSANGVALSDFRSSVSSLRCNSQDGQAYYEVSKQSQWRVVFGDVQRGMAGMPNYKTRFELPAVTMTRDEAAALAKSNPKRDVRVSVTFTRNGDGFQGQADDFMVRGSVKKVLVSDATTGATLVDQTY